MAKTTYYYNPKTCQYHPVRPTFWGVSTYILGLLVTGALLFVVMVFLHDKFTHSDRELQLAKENILLTRHSALLTSQLSTVESTLETLHEKDNWLQEQIFNDTKAKGSMPSPILSNAILLADAEQFERNLESVNQRARHLLQGSEAVNGAFGSTIELSKGSVDDLEKVPTLSPLAVIDLELIVSGFGERIHPFHKGLYSHNGIDLSAPKGTEVRVTAPGIVTRVNTSALQAGYGNYVEVDHGNGFVTRYAHLQDMVVRQGQRIEKEHILGSVGSSGGSIAPHLHYELLYNNKPIDPITYMVEGLDTEMYNKLSAFCSRVNQSLD